MEVDHLRPIPMHEPSSASDRSVQTPERSRGHSRRDVLKATGAGLAGAGLSSVTGTASAAGVTIAPLARDGNEIVDPQGESVTLRGVNVAEPGEQSRDWRGMDAEAVFDMTTAHPDWSNTVVRVPIRPQFVAAGSAAGTGPAPADLPHGDEWGEVLPGTFDESALVDYLDAVVDPLVERAEQNGAYLMLVYDRHVPVFHQPEHGRYVEDGQPIDDAAYDDLSDVWDCGSTADVDHAVHPDVSENFDALPSSERNAGVCGERGLLWHGVDQKEEILQITEEQEPWEFFEAAYDASDGSDTFESVDDVYLEPDAVCDALDAEVRTFWSVVADRYADSDAVLFDVFNQPTGPYAGDWGAPERVQGAQLLIGGEANNFDLWSEKARPFYDLWVDRSQPWMDVVENHGQGQLQTIGNPRWSQYVYWAPYNEYDTENACYSAHVQLQTDCRPLQATVGCAAEHVPVFFSDFGWMDVERYVPTPWLTRFDADGIEWAVGETDPADDSVGDDRESWSYERFLEHSAVHPICSTFDHSTWPNFFDHGEPGVEGDGARGSDHWYDDGHLLETETPGGWWQTFVNERETTVNEGTGGYFAHASYGPNELHGTTEGYAFPTGRDPAPGPCSLVDEGTCGEAGVTAGERLENGDVVCDVDGDGEYRDVTGDGSVTNSDVTAFFRNQHASPMDDRADLFDFTGDDRVGQADVVALFDALN